MSISFLSVTLALVVAGVSVAAAFWIAGRTRASGRVPHVPAQRDTGPSLAEHLAPPRHAATATREHTATADLPGLGGPESPTTRLGAVRPRNYALNPASVPTPSTPIAAAARAGSIARHPSARPSRQLRAGRTSDDVPYMTPEYLDAAISSQGWAMVDRSPSPEPSRYDAPSSGWSSSDTSSWSSSSSSSSDSSSSSSPSSSGE